MPPGLLQRRAWPATAPNGHYEKTAAISCAGRPLLLRLLSPAALPRRPGMTALHGAYAS